MTPVEKHYRSYVYIMHYCKTAMQYTVASVVQCGTSTDDNTLFCIITHHGDESE